MNHNLEELTISENDTILQALAKLDQTAKKLLLIVDQDRRLVRTVTDGDLRRLLLVSGGIDDDLSRIPFRQPVVAKPSISEADAINMMRVNSIRHLPLVDDNGRVVDVLLYEELDKPILLSAPHMGDEELGFVVDAFDSNWIAPIGPNVDFFEKELAEHLGVAHAAAMSSGTAAIHLALVLLDVRPGDTVFCSSLTFVGSANPICYQGAIPVFIDSEPDSWNMSPAALERALLDADAQGQLPKAVIVVNLYGQSADMYPIKALCDRFGVPIVEDAAESLGATYKGRSSGTLGTIGVYSFNGNKIITTAGGGMLVSQEPELVERARFLATQARDQAPYYSHSQVGFNYRMSNILAGIGRGQLMVLNDRVARRRKIFDRYKEDLSDIGMLDWMPEANFGKSNRWLTCATINTDTCALSVTKVLSDLALQGIEARHLWRPMHRQPMFKGSGYYMHDHRSISDSLFERGFCLPSGTSMTDEEQGRVIGVLRGLLLQ